MAIHKNLKKRLSEEQIEAYMKWEERWKGKRWYGEDGNKRLDELLEIVLSGYKRKGEVTGAKKKVIIECDKGHDWETLLVGVVVGGQCPTCFRQKKIRDVWDVYYSILEKFEYEMVVETYISMHKPAKFKCRNGTWFWGTPACVGRGKKKCQCEDCKKRTREKKKQNKGRMY